MALAERLSTLAGKLETDAAGIRRRCATASRHSMNPMRSEAAALERAVRLIRAELPRFEPETTMTTLAELIEAHHAAIARHVAACDLTDEVLAAEQGRAITLDDQDAFDHAGDAEAAALQAVLSHPVAGMSDVSTKAAYLLTVFPRELDGIEPRGLRLLLRSLIPAIELTT